MVVPVIIVAVGVYFAFAPLGLNDGYAGLILAHTRSRHPSSSSPCSRRSRASTARSARIGEPRLAAAHHVSPRDAAADPPGVLSGAVFAFAASFDEVVVALLIAGPGQRTLPRQMFAGITTTSASRSPPRRRC
jgi:putative spermidine/putrescine transport system permease protein